RPLAVDLLAERDERVVRSRHRDPHDQDQNDDESETPQADLAHGFFLLFPRLRVGGFYFEERGPRIFSRIGPGSRARSSPRRLPESSTQATAAFFNGISDPSSPETSRPSNCPRWGWCPTRRMASRSFSAYTSSRISSGSVAGSSATDARNL